MIGRKLGHFEILSLLGEGGMGAVYKAYDSHLERTVALKVLPHDKMADPDRKRRFTKEARAASALNHPNIITIYEINSDDGVDYIAMEFVEGHTLAELLKKSPLPLRDTVKYGRQMADALAAAHLAGIVHRDLKPANVMIRDSGLVKVLDFGLAKLTGQNGPSSDDSTLTMGATSTGTIMGTAAYMSPEQAEGRKLDYRSDIFSYGAVLYEMVTGVRAFGGDSYASVLASVLRDDPRPIAELRPEAPGELSQLVVACLGKNPARRISGMKEIEVELERIANQTSTARGSITFPPSVAAATVAPPPSPAPMTPPRPNPAVPPPAPEKPRKKRRIPVWAWVVFTVFAGPSLFRQVRRDFTDAFFGAPPKSTKSPDGTPATPASNAASLTGNPGIEEWPDFSPDGERVAYDWNGPQGNDFEIYLKPVGPGPAVKLTSGQDAFTPKWSPDGQQIAFGKRDKSGESLALIPAEGGSVKILGPVMGGIRGFAWTPDGGYLVVGESSPTGASLFLWSTSSGERVRMTSAPPSTASGGDQWPSLSPDGKRVAFARGPNASEATLYLLPLSPEYKPVSEPVQVASSGPGVASTAWSADGREVFFDSGPNVYNRTLWRIRAEASAKPKKLEQAGPGAEPAVNAERARLIYTHTTVNQNVWMVDTVNPTAAAPRMIASTGGEWAPRLSPDGKSMVFTSDRSGSIQVWTADAEGRDQRQLTHIEGTNKSAARFSPDGRKIVFISYRVGDSEIFTMDTDGGAKPKRIAHASARDTAPSWSADAKWIYFASDRDGQFEVWKVPVSGGDAVQLTRNGGYAALASPEGKYIYYTKQTTPTALWRAGLDGASEMLVIPEIDQWGNFAVTKKGVYYISPEEKELRFYDFSKKATASIWKTDKPLDSGMSASGDGKHVLVGQTDRSRGELMLLENFH